MSVPLILFIISKMALWICYQTLERARCQKRTQRQRKKNRNLHRFRVFIVLWMGLCSISNGKHINYSNPNEWARWEPTTSGKMGECLARISNSTAYMLLKYDVVESSSENEANSHVWRAKKHHIFLHDYYAASNMLHPSHNFFSIHNFTQNVNWLTEMEFIHF